MIDRKTLHLQNDKPTGTALGNRIKQRYPNVDDDNIKDSDVTSSDTDDGNTIG